MDDGQGQGVPASPSGHSAKPEPVPVSAASAASTPNAVIAEASRILRGVSALDSEDDNGEGYSATCAQIADELDGLLTKSHLIIAPDDLPLAFLEVGDLALGRFARSYLIQIERAVHKSAGSRELPLTLAMSMHGAIALYRIAAEANAGTLTLDHEDVEWGGEHHGDWRVTVERAIARATGAES